MPDYRTVIRIDLIWCVRIGFVLLLRIEADSYNNF